MATYYNIYNDDGNIGCLKPKEEFYHQNGTINNSLLNIELSNNYDKKIFGKNPNTITWNEFESNPYKACEDSAFEKGKEFFLISDFSFNTQPDINNVEYTCYIPKTNQDCSTNTIQNLLNPYKDFLGKLFGYDSDSKPVTSIGYVDMNSISQYNDLSHNNCLKYQSELLLPKNNHFVLYKTDLLYNSEVEKENIKSYKHHNIEYETKFNNDSFNQILSDISSELQSLLCDSTLDAVNVGNKVINNENNLYKNIDRLADKYREMFRALDVISKDISNITLYTELDTMFLRNIQEKIDRKREKYKKLRGFDGANNGKLIDTKYLKNKKISETIILGLILVFLIFIYSKKK